MRKDYSGKKKKDTVHKRFTEVKVFGKKPYQFILLRLFSFLLSPDSPNGLNVIVAQ